MTMTRMMNMSIHTGVAKMIDWHLKEQLRMANGVLLVVLHVMYVLHVCTVVCMCTTLCTSYFFYNCRVKCKS
jgi:hypothetical protein